MHVTRAACLAAVLVGGVCLLGGGAALAGEEDGVFAYHGVFVNSALEVVEPVDEAMYAAIGLDAGSVQALAVAAQGGTGGSAYVGRCRAAGVPIPPAWGGAGWTHVGDLPISKTVVSPTLTAQVWTYRTGAGICYALPRVDMQTQEVQLLGIICQAAESGNACFWDNIGADGQKIAGAATAGMRVEDMQNGDVLAENCTGCHRGDNAFVIHPKTPLDTDTASATKAQAYTPISAQKAWQNPSPSSASFAGCTDCHSVPEVSRPFCATVLASSFRLGLMPPEGAPDPADVATLRAACQAVGVSL